MAGSKRPLQVRDGSQCSAVPCRSTQKRNRHELNASCRPDGTWSAAMVIVEAIVVVIKTTIQSHGMTGLREGQPSVLQRSLLNARLGPIADALREDRLQPGPLCTGERYLVV